MVALGSVIVVGEARRGGVEKQHDDDLAVKIEIEIVALRT